MTTKNTEAAIAHSVSAGTYFARVTTEQQDVLMRDLNSSRVKSRAGKGSYLEAWDVKAHLVRIFGFGGFSATADEAVLRSQREVPQKPRRGEENAPPKFNWEVIYSVRMTLAIPQLQAVYTEYAIGTNSQPDLSSAHDTALKAAESDALKRCAINLGTQFGLSLYNDGSMRNVVQTTLVYPYGWVPVAERTPEQAQAALNQHVEAPDAYGTLLSGAGEDFVIALREWSTVTDNTARITGVQALKTAAADDVLEEAVTYRDSPVTLARLADLVSQGTVKWDE